MGASLCLHASTASAQTAAVSGQGPSWTSGDRSLFEGAGVRTGNLEIHPGIGVEGGYDSNFFLRSSKTDPTIANAAPQAPVEASGRLRVTPSISLTTLGGKRLSDGGGAPRPDVNFDLQADLSYLEFFGSAQMQKQRNVSANARAEATFFPGRPVGFSLGARYTRLVNPNVVGDPNLAYNQDRISGRAAIIVTPGGGALEFQGGYQINASFYKDQAGATNLLHDMFVRSRWRFTPRTSLLSDATVSVLNYNNSTPTSLLLNGTPVRARAGFDGLVTERLGLQILAGYGASLFEDKFTTVRQYSSVIGSARLTWFFLGASPGDQATSTIQSQLVVGYSRDFAASFLGNYVGIDRPYLEASTTLAGRVLLTAIAGLSVLTYPDIPLLSNPNAIRATAFTNLRPDVSGFAEYRFTDSVGVNLTVRYGQTVSDVILRDPLDPNGSFDLAWNRVEAYAGLRWFL